MAWNELQPAPKNEPQKAPVRVGTLKIRGSRARLVIVCKGAVLDLLGGKEKRYRVSLGGGEDAHRCRIAQDDAGPFKPAEFGKAKGSIYYRFALPAQEYIADEKRELEACIFTHEKLAKALLIDLPPYAWRKGGVSRK